MDVFIGDSPLLDYVRGEDCNLRLLGQSLFEDAYAIGMQKGFPLKVNFVLLLQWWLKVEKLTQNADFLTIKLIVTTSKKVIETSGVANKYNPYNQIQSMYHFNVANS